MPSNVVYGNKLIQSKKKQIINIKGNDGMTLVSPAGYIDDANYNVSDIGFDFPFYGTNYRSNIFVGTNSYITFGFGSNNYQNLNFTNPGRGILIAAEDNGIIGGIYVKQDVTGTSFRIRFEGTNRLATPYEKNIVWEVTLFSNGNILINTDTIIHRTQVYGAVSMITKGDGIKFTSFANASNQRLVYNYNSTTDNYTLN